MSQFVDETEHSTDLRLGDVISGFSHIVPSFVDCFTNATEFSLDIKSQPLFVVLTPCCSIEDSMINVVPLRQLKSSYLLNTFYVEDFTRINRPMPPKNGVPPKQWENMDEEQRAQIEGEEPTYTLKNIFIYNSNPKLPKYDLKYKEINLVDVSAYMIDFKESFTLKSATIARGNTYPKEHQLNISTRGELRNKLSDYYSRIPEEDMI